MQVTWTESAISDLNSIHEYIKRENPEAAQRVAASIIDAVDLLIGNPEIGRPGRVSGTRELLISEYPYIIPYRIRGDWIELLRVLHSRRDWPEEL